MNDNDSPRRAANSHLAQQLPAHGNHAGPSAHSAPVDTAGPGSFVIPARAVSTPEKSSVVYEAKIGSNVARRGTVTHAEGLTTRDPNLEAAFGQSFSSSRSASYQTYGMQPSGQRSPLTGPANSGNPAWVDDQAALFYFGQGTEGSEDATRSPGEHGQQTYQRAIAHNPRNRRNNATVED